MGAFFDNWENAGMLNGGSVSKNKYIFLGVKMADSIVLLTYPLKKLLSKRSFNNYNFSKLEYGQGGKNTEFDLKA